MAMAIAMKLAQIRSLSIMGQSTWVPSLLELKFVRVLSIDVIISYSTDMVVDLTIVNQLSQLRYLKVKKERRF